MVYGSSGLFYRKIISFQRFFLSEHLLIEKSVSQTPFDQTPFDRKVVLLDYYLTERRLTETIFH
jgi:hypothetical protein